MTLEEAKYLILQREVNEPKRDTDRMHNSDDPAKDKVLAKNEEALNAAYKLTSLADKTKIRGEIIP